MSDISRLWTAPTLHLADALASAGREVRIVGGAVRDALAGRPCKDTDLATDATPREMLLLGDRAGIRTIPTLAEAEADPGAWDKGGLRHGTVSFVIGGEVIEATTLRVDTATDGRHAEVAFVRDFAADAARRDLTFNAMSVDRAGRLHDPFGGAADLAAGIVRFVGDADARIREDYLRILRYFRFRARYGVLGAHGPTEAATEAAIAGNAPGLARISGERIWAEMSRMLTTERGLQQLPAMRRTGVVGVIGLAVGDPAVAAAALAVRGGAAPATVLGILLANLDDKPSGTPGSPVVALKARWKLSTEEADLAEFVRLHANMAAAPFPEFQRLATLPRARPADVAQLLRGLGRPEQAAWLLSHLPVFPVWGADLLEHGHTPGKAIGEAITSLHAAWVESNYTATREQLLATVREPGATPSGRRP